MRTLAIAALRGLRINAEIVDYLKRIDATLEPFEGRFLVHGSPAESLEGDGFGQLVIIAFPDRQKARDWYESADYQAILPLRLRNAECAAVLIDTVEETYAAAPLADKLAAAVATLSPPPKETSSDPIITAFAQSPDEGRGLARDMRVRWALEEVGQPYDVRLVSFAEMKQAEHLVRHPFGQIPTYEEGDLALFESGGIIWRVAEGRSGLLPEDGDARARAISWMFAAVSTVEPPIVDLEVAMYVERKQPWHEARVPLLKDRIRSRLTFLSRHLGDADWLDGAFSAADIMMVLVLRRLEGSGVLEEFPNLSTYVARGESRPAYQRAFADQLAVFRNLHAAD